MRIEYTCLSIVDEVLAMERIKAVTTHYNLEHKISHRPHDGCSIRDIVCHIEEGGILAYTLRTGNEISALVHSFTAFSQYTMDTEYHRD